MKGVEESRWEVLVGEGVERVGVLGWIVEERGGGEIGVRRLWRWDGLVCGVMKVGKGGLIKW